jgi:hypothetical protein
MLPSVPIAYAQEPTGECVPISSTVYLYNYVGSSTEIEPDGDVQNITNAYGISDTNYARLWAPSNYWAWYSFSLEDVISGSISLETIYDDSNVWSASVCFSPNLNNDPDGDWDCSYGRSTNYDGVVGSVLYRLKAPVLAGGFMYLDAAHITIDGCYYPPVISQTCSTVQDFHFTGSPTDTWTLDGSASILSSTLTINPTGAATQTISTTLQSLSVYNAVLSVTNAVSAPVIVTLGGLTQTITITGAGFYTATFTTTTEITSAAYALFNAGESEHYVDVDWTCIYEADSVTESCLAPLNGEFDTADYWDFYRGAVYNAPSKNALLPYNAGGDTERSLLVTTGVYSLPTLQAGQFLALRFTGQSKSGQEALVASRVLSAWHEFQINERSTLYADISSQAGQQATVSFANAGQDGSQGAEECSFPAQDDALIDDVCIYITTTPIEPSTVITNTFCPVDLTGDFDCDDVDALLAGYGINVYAVEPIYAAGPTWADPSGYIPWLAAALWLHVGKPISCLIVEFMRMVLDLTGYQVNVFANFTGWNYETTANGVTWLQSGLYQPPLSIARWINWYSSSSRNVLSSVGINSITYTSWLARLIEAVMPSSLWQNALALVFSGFSAALGDSLSDVMNTLVLTWNNSILTYFYLTVGHGAVAAVPPADPTNPASPWSRVLDSFLWLFSSVGSIVDFVWSLFSWLVNTLLSGSTAPIDAYHSFASSVSEPAYVSPDILCVDDGDFWCYFWAGVQLINQTATQSVAYPFIIIGLVLATIVIVFANLYALFHLELG